MPPPPRIEPKYEAKLIRESQMQWPHNGDKIYMSSISTIPDTSYLTQRLAELGISDDQNTFTRVWTSRVDDKQEDGKIITFERENTRTYKIFDADDEGNIVIRYFNLQ